jgi:hypothetical protein
MLTQRRISKRLAPVFAVALFSCAALPQQAGDIAPLRHGRLIVWVVKPAPGKAVPVSTQPPTTLQQQTAGSFGQSASDVGTSASNYGVSASSPTISRTGSAPASAQGADPNNEVATAAGYHEQTAGSYGQTAGSFGTAASNHGQTASSLGHTASSVGTNAGDYGQTAGSFGHSLSTIAGAGQVPPPKPLQQQIEPTLRAEYPALQVRFVYTDESALKAALKAATSTSYPDVLLFEGYGPFWPGPSPDLRDLSVSSDTDSSPPSSIARALMMNRAPHPDVAHAFLLFLAELDEARASGSGQR